VGGLVSCLGLFAYSGVQHIFALFFFIVCAKFLPNIDKFQELCTKKSNKNKKQQPNS
jgi:hypothetical protein